MSIRSITATLGTMQGGTFIDQASDKLANLVRRVDETGKAGKLVITLEVKKVGQAVSVLGDITDKVPKTKPDADLFYATVEGNLSLDNPNQRALKFGSVEKTTAPIKDAESATTVFREAHG